MFERGGMGPLKKVLILVQRPQHKSTSDSVRAPNNVIWRYFYRMWVLLKNATLFGGSN